MLTNEFFEFLRKREQVRLNRASGLPREQWTDDPILQKYKFTNVKREHDRTTRELMERFYSGHETDPASIRLLNCVTARFFGHVDTVVELGWRNHWSDETLHDMKRIIEERIARREKIFTGAYIIPNCGRTDPKHVVVLDIIDQVRSLVRGGEWWHRELTFREFTKWLCHCITGVGSFTAKEVILDFILSSGWTPSDWQTWTPIGPGARRGAARVLSVDGCLGSPLSEPNALGVALDLYAAYRQQPMQVAGGVQIAEPLWPEAWVKLDLADIQFQLCEFDKYMRAKTGIGKPKTLFRPRSD